MKLVHCLPALFVVGVVALLLLGICCPLLYVALLLYVLLLFIDATIQNRNFCIGMLSVVAAFTQLFGYGIGFIKEKTKSKN